jgi:hypothetical protein
MREAMGGKQGTQANHTVTNNKNFTKVAASYGITPKVPKETTQKILGGAKAPRAK